MAEDKNSQEQENRDSPISQLSKKLEEDNRLSHEYADISYDRLKSMDESLKSIAAQLGKTYEFLVGNSLADEEERREFLRALADLKPKDQKKDPQKPQGGDDLGLLGALGAIAGLITGAVAGYVGGVLKILNNSVIKPIKNLFKAIGKNIIRAMGFEPDELTKAIRARYRLMRMRIRKGFNNAIKTITDGFKNLIKPITDRLKSLSSSIIGEKGFFGRILTRVKNFFGPDALKALDTIKKAILSPFTFIKNFVSGGASMFKPVTEFFKTIKPFFNTFKALGGVIGKAFAPLGVILSIFDGVSEGSEAVDKVGGEGGVKGFLKKLLAGVTGFIGGVIDGAIAKLLDLIKDGLAWVAGALGFKELEKDLNSFSFSEMWNDILDSIYELIDSPIEWIKKKFEEGKKVFENALGTGGNTLNSINEFLKGVLRSALPDPSQPFDPLKVESYISGVIPDFVYEYAGLNPETGEILPTPSDTGGQLDQLAEAAAAAGMNMDRVTAELAAGRSVDVAGFGRASMDSAGEIQVVPIEAQSTPRGREMDDIADGNLNIGGA